jgi:hypothetical protein
LEGRESASEIVFASAKIEKIEFEGGAALLRIVELLSICISHSIDIRHFLITFESESRLRGIGESTFFGC